jgi:hypothetical protein
MSLPQIPINVDARGATINSVGQDQFNISRVDLSTHNTTHHNNGDTTFNNTIIYVVYARESSGDTTADGQILQAHPASEAAELVSLPRGPSTNAIFVNYLDVEAWIGWINFDGERVHYNMLIPGQLYIQRTYVGHPWLVCAGLEQSPVAMFHPLLNDSHALITPNLLNTNMTSHSGTQH